MRHGENHARLQALHSTGLKFGIPECASVSFLDADAQVWAIQ